MDIVINLQDRASKALAGLRGKMGKLASVAGKLLKVGMLAGAAGIAAAGFAAFKFGNDFLKANNIIRVGTGATGAALEGLEEDFKAAFADTPADMKTVAQATADLNSIGLWAQVHVQLTGADRLGVLVPLAAAGPPGHRDHAGNGLYLQLDFPGGPVGLGE